MVQTVHIIPVSGIGYEQHAALLDPFGRARLTRINSKKFFYPQGCAYQEVRQLAVKWTPALLGIARSKRVKLFHRHYTGNRH